MNDALFRGFEKQRGFCRFSLGPEKQVYTFALRISNVLPPWGSIYLLVYISISLCQNFELSLSISILNLLKRVLGGESLRESLVGGYGEW